MRYIIGIIILFSLLAPAFAADAPKNETVVNASVTARLKDITRVCGARENQLFGYGLVIGLDGTGDTANTVFTVNTVTSMLQRLGVTIPQGRIRLKNVAAVMVTANIGPFGKSGDRLDVTVSSLGDATSLQGGTLLQTPLQGADSHVYAVAQGALSLGGFAASAGGASTKSGHPTVGRIPNGALIEQEIPMQFVVQNRLSLSLTNPDFSTAARIATVVREHLKVGDTQVAARDAATVDITIPETYRQKVVELIGVLGDLRVPVDVPAKVVVNERTGTVVIGGQATVLPVALAQGDLTITVNPAFFASQPPPFSSGSTVTEHSADIEVKDSRVSLMEVRGSTVDELVRTLNLMRVSPRDIIAILQALKQAGALQAELQVL